MCGQHYTFAVQVTFLVAHIAVAQLCAVSILQTLCAHVCVFVCW